VAPRAGYHSAVDSAAGYAAGYPVVDHVDRVVVRSRHNRIFSAVGMALGAAFCAQLAVRLHAPGWRVAALVAALGLAAWTVRAALIGVVCTGEHLLIRDLSRSRRLSWSQVQSVIYRANARHYGSPVFVLVDFDARGRTRVPAMCLVSKDPATTRAWVEQLEELRTRVAHSSV